MIDVRIVCTHDAVKTAQALKRLLEAETYSADICYGRSSLALLEDARARREAVVLIWSVDAPTAHYMLQWAQAIEPSRLVEIARAHVDLPLHGKRAAMIDFSGWSENQRGGVAWRALEDRLKQIARSFEPKKPVPWRAATALSATAAAAAFGAYAVRASYDGAHPLDPVYDGAPMAENYAEGGRGGPATRVFEPASMDDETQIRLRALAPLARPLEAPYTGELSDVAPLADPMSFPEPTLMDRARAFAAPLMGED